MTSSDHTTKLTGPAIVLNYVLMCQMRAVCFNDVYQDTNKASLAGLNLVLGPAVTEPQHTPNDMQQHTDPITINCALSYWHQLVHSYYTCADSRADDSQCSSQ